MTSAPHQNAKDTNQEQSSEERLKALLRQAGLRPTRQRMALASMFFNQGNRHITAESAYSEAQMAGVEVSLATVYNALHTFTRKGLLREISIESSRSYFDTNTEEHHHFYFEKSGKLKDISPENIQISRLPEAPDGMDVTRVDVVIRIDG